MLLRTNDIKSHLKEKLKLWSLMPLHCNNIGSLSLLKKAQTLEANAIAHKHHWEPLPPKKKATFLEADAIALQQHWEYLPPEQKARTLGGIAIAHKHHWESPLSRRKPNFWRLMSLYTNNIWNISLLKKTQTLDANAIAHKQHW
jgi:hypothetical protein